MINYNGESKIIKALVDAVNKGTGGGAEIDDDHISKETTYSSAKIEEVAELPDDVAFIEEDETVEIEEDPTLHRSDVINSLLSSAEDMPLSAAQGKQLKALIDAMSGGGGGYIENEEINNDDPVIKNRFYKLSKTAATGSGLGDIYVCGRNPQNDGNCRAEVEVPSGHYLVVAGAFSGGRIENYHGLSLVAVGRDNNSKILTLAGSGYVGADASGWADNKFKIYYTRYNNWCMIAALKIAPIIPL